MYHTRLCLNLTARTTEEALSQMTLYRNVGFDAFFTNWHIGYDMSQLSAQAAAVGLQYHSVHAPITGTPVMWEEGEAGDAALAELLRCLHDTAGHGVSLLICHAFLGFGMPAPTQRGIERFGILVREAERLGVRIAFENAEGEAYLFALMEAFRGERHVGFCWDTGHQMCYNLRTAWLDHFGTRLIATHLNDNMGCCSFDGRIRAQDDLHLFPYDGIGDWEDITARLRRCGYTDILTFELKPCAQTDRLECRMQNRLSMEEYVTEAYKRACRVARSFETHT